MTETELDPASEPRPAPTPPSVLPVDSESTALASARREFAKLNQRYLSAVEKGGKQKAAAKEAFDKVNLAVDNEIDTARREMLRQRELVGQLEAAEPKKAA